MRVRLGLARLAMSRALELRKRSISMSWRGGTTQRTWLGARLGPGLGLRSGLGFGLGLGSWLGFGVTVAMFRLEFGLGQGLGSGL